MRKVVPFTNTCTFNTDVYEVTAISLEHDIKKEANTISGVFHISGEYKPTISSLERESFNFDLPFDIALTDNYDMDTLKVDVDDFRYELTDKKELKVNIDLYLDGEIKEEDEEPLFTEEEIREMTDNEEVMPVMEPEIVHEEVTNNNENVNIFNGFNEEEKYVTYHVYPVTENDTLDRILEKYHITKEEFLKYNPSVDINVGNKLIIPTNNE